MADWLRSILFTGTTLVLMTTGITSRAADTMPNACVSCHVVVTEQGKPPQDHRLSTMLKAWSAGKVDADLLAKSKATMPAGVTLKGKHPAADDALEDIPTNCLDCHGSDSKKAPPFAKLMHLVHLTGKDNAYMATFKGDCRTCHKLNVQNGEWSLPSGAEK